MIIPEISIGSIITIATVLLGLSGFYWRTTMDGKAFKDDIVEIKTDLKMLNKIMTDLAVQDKRLDNQADRIGNIERQIDTRISAMDQRMLAQGERIDSTATIINGRLEAINNIVSGHTAQLNNLRQKA